MAEIGEGVHWEGGWSRKPAAEQLVAKPNPEHDSDTVDIPPSNSKPADHISEDAWAQLQLNLTNHLTGKD